MDDDASHNDNQNDHPGLTGDVEGTVLGAIKQKLVKSKEQWVRLELGYLAATKVELSQVPRGP